MEPSRAGPTVVTCRLGVGRYWGSLWAGVEVSVCGVKRGLALL